MSLFESPPRLGHAARGPGARVAVLVGALATGAVATTRARADDIDVDGAGILHRDVTAEGGLRCRPIEACVPYEGGRLCDSRGETCASLRYGARMVSGCVHLPTATFCCSNSMACPVLTSSGPLQCRRLVGEAGRELDFGVCVYEFAFCAPAMGRAAPLDAEVVARCLGPLGCRSDGSRPEPYGLESWMNGDCDCDGRKNGGDSDPCLPLDGGPSDAAVVDAAAEEDAGEPLGADLGAAPEMDAGLPSGFGIDFRGGGGCTCDAVGSRWGATRGAARDLGAPGTNVGIGTLSVVAAGTALGARARRRRGPHSRAV